MKCVGLAWPLSVVLSTFLLTGCAATMSIPYENMTAEQIAAAVKDKNLTWWCAIANTPYGRGVVTILNLDRQVLPANSLFKSGEGCAFELSTGEAAGKKL